MSNITSEPSTWKMLNTQMTFPELFRAIPKSVLNNIVLVLLCFVALLPLLAAVLSPLDEFIFTRHMPLNTAFRTVGYAGLIFGVFMLFWNKYNIGKSAKTLWQRLRDNGLIIFLGAMLIWSTISTVFSTNVDLSFYGDSYRMDGLLSYLGYAGIFILAINLSDRKHIQIVLNVLCASAAILALLCLIDVPAINSYCRIARDLAVFSNSNHYGYYICMVIMSCVLLLATDKKKKRTTATIAVIAVHIAELILLSNALIQCKSLGPLLAVAFALLVLFVLTFFVDRPKAKRIGAIVLLIVIVAGVSTIDTWDLGKEAHELSTDLETIHSASSGSDTENSIDDIGSGRGILWAGAVQFIGERPVFGYGPDNLGERYTEIGARNDRPHNEILQFAASLGIPAALFYVLAMLFHLIMFIRNFKRIDMTILCSYCIVLAYLVSSMFGNTMFYTTPFFFMLLGFSYALIRPINDGTLDGDEEVLLEKE